MVINSVTVSGIDDYVAQIASLKKRMYSNSYLETVEKSLNFSEASFSRRMNRITADGEDFGDAESYEFYKKDVVGLTDTAGVPLLTTNVFSIAATGIMLFATGTVPNVSQIFKVGDILEITSTGANIGVSKYKAEVVRLAGAATLQLGNYIVTAYDVFAAQALGGVVNAIGDVGIKLFRKKQLPRANSIELIWKPCLGFWDLNQWLPSGAYNMKLTPHPKTVFQRYVIESNRNLTVDTDFKVEISNLLLYIYKGTGEPIKGGSIKLNYEEIRLQMQSLTTTSLNQKTFVINPNAHALTLAYQDNSAGEDTRFSRSKFKIRNEEEKAISRFYLRKGGYELPTPKPDPDLRSGATQFIGQIYAENLFYSMNYYNAGGQETIEKWLDRGLYYHYQFEEGSDDDRVYVSQQFLGLPNNNSFTTNPNILLFDHYYRECVLEVRDGQIYKVMRSAIN